ncbi:RagB/SusD family nutrient uptake outer membrane protein [Flavobacterium sediminilitoris]|uniref:RagB/SusD family nutrient uptake outer membrane protein n=1 Tax=Flavobacterium sediminilitoris TaxID=2024526 RepID=A0ABY4HQR1_9FLAO|nr:MULTISPECIES: RagB/SusD family nutrient uptake outer membrane protein [Flavobacterium]UOX34561.1 RagB/SusD family nutrient uptake outer membrane protein [Flavobacterium sediminilitoris]
MKNISKYIILFTIAIGMNSCDDYLDIKPEGKVIPETLEDFRAVLTTGYSAFPRHKSLTTLRADELVLNEFDDQLLYSKDIYIWKDANPDPATTSFQWAQLYNTIFYTNVVINDGNAKVPSSPEKDQLIGEAYALRALTYFDLINLFGKPYNTTSSSSDRGVPLALEIDLEQEFIPESVANVYTQILSDIDDAKNLLNQDTQVTGLNYRFSKAAIYALEARVRLYRNEWQKALDAVNIALSYRNELIDLNTDSTLPNKYDTVESVMALEDVFTNSLKVSTYVSPELIAAFDQTNDLRFPLYFEASGSRFQFEKGGEQEQKCTFRTSELYLIKAEAELRLNNFSDSKTTLLPLLQKRYTPTAYTQLSTDINTMSDQDFTIFLFEERKRELAVEGHRWFDLRRMNQKQIIHQVEGQDYTLIENDPRYTLPYPRNAQLNNPNL